MERGKIMKRTEYSLKMKLQLAIVSTMSAIIICLFLLVIIEEPSSAMAAETLSIETTIAEVPTEQEVQPCYTITAEERELMARLVHCEASNQSQECRIAVASVIFNRLDSGKWGNSITDVINYPCAFTPVLYDQLYVWDIDECDYEAVDYVVMNGPTVPTYVRYFRANYDHKWDGYANYCVYEDTYFGYMEDWEHGAW